MDFYLIVALIAWLIGFLHKKHENKKRSIKNDKVMDSKVDVENEEK